MDEVIYRHIVPEGDLSPLDVTVPFKVVLVVDADASREWRNAVAEWLAHSQCRYAMAWGRACETWHDAIDLAHVRGFAGEIPDDLFIITTWHADETLREVFWFAQNCASHPIWPLDQTIIVHIAPCEHGSELVALFGSDPSEV
jgi:hypothetical protein